MVNLNNEKLIEYIPQLFKIDLKNGVSCDSVFTKISEVFDFDFAHIYYLNPASVQLKYSTTNKELINKVFKVSPQNLNMLYSDKCCILNEKSSLIKSLNFIGCKSFLLGKLLIGETIFGIIILASRKENNYSKNDVNALKTCCSILAYVIKDNELSNVFKIQLKALKDGIIEKNEAYKVIKEQNEKILETDKVKNEFLANISHELRTPLNAIIGFSEILSAGLYGKLNDKQAEYVSDIRVSGIHLLGMINEILDLSKIEAKAVKLVRSEFGIKRAITESANILHPLAAKKNVKIIIDCGYDFNVYADYQKIQQILYNLVNNAIKFSPENDEVVISAHKKRKKFVLEVHDNGIGIDKKYHGKIFAKFVQLDSAYTKKESSTGLGLTITKELTELHGGKISIKSEINSGSTFIVELPLLFK